MEPPSLAPTPVEMVYVVASVAALLFAVHAVRRISRGDWPLGYGLTLVLLTLVVPFSGPVIVGSRTVVRRWAQTGAGSHSAAGSRRTT